MATMREITGPNGHLAHIRDFKGNSLRGDVCQIVPGWYGYHGTVGQLPYEYQAKLAEASERGTLAYVVRSYLTPIAWVETDGTVTIPDIRYSTTTSRHQGACRVWLPMAAQTATV